MSIIAGKLRRNAEFLERKGWSKSAVLEREAAAELEAQEQRYADGLAAWRENNLHHQARIDELEKRVAELQQNLDDVAKYG